MADQHQRPCALEIQSVCGWTLPWRITYTRPKPLIVQCCEQGLREHKSSLRSSFGVEVCIIAESHHPGHLCVVWTVLTVVRRVSELVRQEISKPKPAIRGCPCCECVSPKSVDCHDATIESVELVTRHGHRILDICVERRWA